MKIAFPCIPSSTVLSFTPAPLVVVLASCLLGCGDSAIGTDRCTDNSSCPEGQICSPDGRCISPPTDAGVDAPVTCPSGVLCGLSEVCCEANEACLASRCIAARTCTDDNGCIDDTYCHEGQCIPWGTGPRGDHDPDCTLAVPIGLFSPTEQCTWTGPPSGDRHPNHENVLTTPVVIDFDFDGDDEVRKPSIVFTSYDGNDGEARAADCADDFFGVVRVIDGETCRQQHTVDMAKLRASSPLAVADLDGDGRAEIIAARCGGGLAAFDFDATRGAFDLLWTSNPNDVGPAGGGWAGPSIHDLDDDGKPEILLWGTVWSSTGLLLDQSLGHLQSISAGYLAVAANLDDDARIEMTDGTTIWEWHDSGGTASWQPSVHTPSLTGGQIAIADFGSFASDPASDDRSKTDGIPEIAVVGLGELRVQTIAGRIVFGPVPLPAPSGDPGTGGPPTIGDFDNDGRVELAAAGRDAFAVFDPDCQGSPEATTCASLRTDGVLWFQISQDHTSNVTGSSVFDFDGDGQVEAIYADECFTRVYDGKSGEVLYSQWRSSCTWYENPIVADVDGDFNSELVVPSNNNCTGDDNDPHIKCRDNTEGKYDVHPVTGLTLDPLFKGLRCETAADCPGGPCDAGFCRCTGDSQCGGDGFVCGPAKAGTEGSGDVCRAAYLETIQGVRVYRDARDRWVNSRMIWNQHAYAVTNVDEGGTIPQSSAWLRNWRQPGLNNFRQNTQGGLNPLASPDLTARRLGTLSCDRSGNIELEVEVCNRGTQPVGQGVPVAFYREQSASGELICTAETPRQIDPGRCREVRCVWQDAPRTIPDVLVVADDDGTGEGVNNECKEGNNATILRGISCLTIF